MNKKEIDKILEEANEVFSNKSDKQIQQFYSIRGKGGIIGGTIMGYKHLKNKTGLFSMSKSKKKEVVTNGGKSAGKLAVKNGTVSKAGKISAKSPNHVNNKILKCPHCKMEGAYPTMKRWHMDNCKHK
jgi:hypothetical protein